jgi:hypothetical protein
MLITSLVEFPFLNAEMAKAQCPVGEFRCDQFACCLGFTINGSISP